MLPFLQRRRCVSALLLMVGFGFVGAAPAQIQLTARAEHPRVLQYERIRVEFKVANLSAYPLPVGGADGAKLTFRVERRPGFPLDLEEAGVSIEPFVVAPRKTTTGWADLTLAYNMGKTGPYPLQARLDWDGVRNQSSRFYVDVVPGLVVRTLNIGVEDGQRQVSLRTLSRDQTQRLFLRVEDNRKQVCYGVQDLGRFLRYEKPNLMVDAAGQVHVLHQSGPTRYTHSIHTSDAVPVRSEFVGKQGQAAQLIVDKSGKVGVSGAEVYTGDVSVDRPQIRSFDPFTSGSRRPGER